MTGKTLSWRNQAADAAASSATMNCKSSRRPSRAWANAATPRGVNGSHAKFEFPAALIGSQHKQKGRTDKRICAAAAAGKNQAGVPPGGGGFWLGGGAWMTGTG